MCSALVIFICIKFKENYISEITLHNTENTLRKFIITMHLCVQKVTRLNLEIKRTGLKINKEKTKVIRMNADTNKNIQVDGRDLEDAESFVYLGVKVCKSGGASEDTRAKKSNGSL